jgi:hypothetical protein
VSPGDRKMVAYAAWANGYENNGVSS